MKLDESILQIVCCPKCKSDLASTNEDYLSCTNGACCTVFPVSNGVPVLINESRSIFRIQQLIDRKRPQPEASTAIGRLRREVVKKKNAIVPEISKNVGAKRNYPRVESLLLSKTPNPKVLVIGGGELGQGLDTIMQSPSIEFVETDVTFGARVSLICDAHDLPFAESSFDGVISQAVLEHVVDPYSCVEEIHRVLNTDGLVYAETPFMQQVHGGAHDFTRFTHLGHRRLFRGFAEVDSGVVCGPGMALAWAYKYFFQSFVTSRRASALLSDFASLTSFWLKFFDRYLANKPGALDAASAYYFLGRKSAVSLSDEELIRVYRGAM